MAIVRTVKQRDVFEGHPERTRKVPKVSLLSAGYSVQTVDRITKIGNRVDKFCKVYQGNIPEVYIIRHDILTLHRHLIGNANLARQNEAERIKLEKYASSQLKIMEARFEELTEHIKLYLFLFQ